MESIEIITEESDLVTLPKYRIRHLRVVSQVCKIAKHWTHLTNKNRNLNIELGAISKFTSEKEITSIDIELSEHIIFVQEQCHESFENIQKRFSDKKLIRDESGVVEETNEKLPTEFKTSEPSQKIAPKTRQILPRASKTRAHDFFRNMDSDSNHAYGAISRSSSLIFLTVLCSMMSPAIAVNNSTIISCSNGVVSVPPLKGWFELCIDNDCQSMNNTTRYVKYLLPISPTEKGAEVRLRTLSSDGVQEQQWLCDRPKFCEHQYFLSKSLLGNPHCWPAGAIASSAVLIYIIIAVIMGAIWITLKSPEIAGKPERNEPEIPTAPVCSFELTPLPTLLVCVP
ncbi:hypothetical protein OSTOST_05030 [Ostertagia ostertagi]